MRTLYLRNLFPDRPHFGGALNLKMLKNSWLSLIAEQDSGVQQQPRVPEGAPDPLHPQQGAGTQDQTHHRLHKGDGVYF